MPAPRTVDLARDPHGTCSVPAARDLVDRFEASVSDDDRRSGGVHYTPHRVARAVCRQAFDLVGHVPGRVHDPACGAGAFLLAAADELVDRGVEPRDAVSRLTGTDIDPAAVVAAREALKVWLAGHGEPGGRCPAGLRVADTLELPAPLRSRADVVVGNPPFLSPLRASSGFVPPRRWLDAGPNTDASALFLSAAVTDMVTPSGVVALLQPLSLLSSRDAHWVRSALDARLDTLWVPPARLFPHAAVHVCVPFIVPAARTARVTASLEGAGVELPLPVGGSWAPLGAVADGVPPVTATAGRLGDLCSVAAGFRDLFYAVAEHVVDNPEGGAPVLTSGSIDPLDSLWGIRPARIAGVELTHPTLDIDRLGHRAHQWVTARMVPKVLMATQTKVCEAWVDEAGVAVPLTPVVAAVPNNQADLWRVAAAISSPAVSAHLAAVRWGAGRGPASVSSTAPTVAAAPLPAHTDPWNDAAVLLAELAQLPAASRSAGWLRFAELMGAAYDVDGSVGEWWWSRHPQRRD